jgi:ribosomal protein S14
MRLCNYVDIKNRAYYKKTEIFRRVLKMLYIKCFTLMHRLIIQKTFFKKLISSKICIRNFCVITGRSRGVYKKFYASRMTMRLLGAEGLYFGLKKKSW